MKKVIAASSPGKAIQETNLLKTNDPKHANLKGHHIRRASHRPDISEQCGKERKALFKHARKKHQRVLWAWEAHRELAEHRRNERRIKQNRKRWKTISNHNSKHFTHSVPGHNGPAPTNTRRWPYGEKLQIATLNCCSLRTKQGKENN